MKKVTKLVDSSLPIHGFGRYTYFFDVIFPSSRLNKLDFLASYSPGEKTANEGGRNGEPGGMIKSLFSTTAKIEFLRSCFHLAAGCPVERHRKNILENPPNRLKD